MYFNDFASLLAMNGHGVYVWTAVIITLLIMLSQIVAPLVKTRRFFRAHRRRWRGELN